MVSVLDYPPLQSETNDTGRFSRAIAALNVGDILDIPPKPGGGSYIITKEFVLPENVTVRGYGNGSQIKQVSRETNIFILSNGNFIERLHFEGDYGTGGVSTEKNNGLYARSAKRVYIGHCNFQGFETAGIQIRNAEDIIIENNYFYDNYWGNFPICSDILIYSEISGKRIIIKNNYCLSDNSQGIFVNPFGRDTEIIIDGNVMSTTTSNQIDATPTKRRHGIVAAYNGSSEGSKIIMTNNIIKNTLWSGIYATSNNTEHNSIGEYIITNNIITNTALSQGNPISGGIVLYGGGYGDIIANNVIENVPNSAGIKLNHLLTSNIRTIVHHNTIKKAYHGIYAVTNSRNIYLESNTIKDCLQYDINVALNNSSTDTKVKIHNNFITKNLMTRSIVIDTQSSSNLIEVSGNTLYGIGNVTIDDPLNNSAIYIRNTPIVKLIANYIKGFYYGIFYEDVITGRVIDKIRIEGNTFENLSNGIILKANSSSSVVPVIENNFINVTKMLSGLGSYPAGYIGKTENENIVLYLNSVPKIGTFKIGDRFINPNPVEGGISGGVCIADGTPGLWRVEQIGFKTSITQPPSYIGEKAIVGGVIYMAINTSTSSDWKPIS